MTPMLSDEKCGPSPEPGQCMIHCVDVKERAKLRVEGRCEFLLRSRLDRISPQEIPELSVTLERQIRCCSMLLPREKTSTRIVLVVLPRCVRVIELDELVRPLVPGLRSLLMLLDESHLESKQVVEHSKVELLELL